VGPVPLQSSFEIARVVDKPSSRSGEPDWKTASGSPIPPEWSKKVTWAKGNILSPATYKEHLSDATAVVHSMGILLEADYKGVLSGKENPITGLRRAFDSRKGASRNPLKEGDESPQLTYETMNRDSGMEPPLSHVDATC
jgi:hypothetical protein